MCENWRVLPLKKEDAVELARLEELCFSEPWSQEALAGEVENPNAAVFVAWWGDKIAGYAGLHYMFDEAEVTNVAVFPEFRGKGAGRRLLRAQKEFCREKGILLLSLEVRESNRTAIGLYESEGFVPICLRKNYYSRPLEHGWLYQYSFENETENVT